jgi:FkbM family methyltransferase
MRDPSSINPRLPPRWRDRILARYRALGWRGFIRLYGLLKPPAGRREIQVRTRYGTQFLVSPWDSVDSHVIAEGFYESEVFEALRPVLAAPDAVLWVIGANFGLHAVTAKALYPHARVVAFEPSPAMGARFIDHCFLNSVEIDLHAYALSDKAGFLPFHANASGNPGMSTLHPSVGLPYDHRFFVATNSPARVITEGLAPAPTALLVDAEGAEEEIMRGFGAHLAASTLRRIVFEAPNEFLTQCDPLALHALITDGGFTLEKLERREKTAHALSNFVAVKP